jgi:hypothetical protein
MRLLISPLNREEAIAAVKGGADIIDVKNPVEGSLGANFPWVIKSIKRVLPKGVELSATLGDLEFKPGTASLAAYGLASLGVDYIKAGLFGIATEAQAREMADRIIKAVKDFDVKVVLAGYADYGGVPSISPLLLPEIASSSGAYGVMVDTAKKDGRTLIDHLNLERLKKFIDASHEQGLKVALAGSLGMEEVLRLREVNPDIIGVRGMVCSGDRIKGRISEEKVRQLKTRIQDKELGLG